jgi:hypothetical protein
MEGAIVGEGGEETGAGWLERVKKMIDIIRMTMITPNPPKRRTKVGRSD